MIDLDTKREFLRIEGDLSPENLTCDGELSRSKVQQRLRALKAAWKALETKIGRKVSSDEVWSWHEEIAAADKADHDARVAAEFKQSGLDPNQFFFNGTGVWGRKGQPNSIGGHNMAYTIRNPKRQMAGFGNKLGDLLGGDDVYQLESELAYRLDSRRFGKMGTYATLEDAIRAGEEFISPITTDFVRARCPQMREQAVQELLRYLP